MATATINGYTGNEYIDAKIVWSSTANFNDNSSSVTAALYYKRNNSGFTTSGTGTFSITINGQKKSETKSITITESSWVKVVEHTVTVGHKDDGTKSITISASGSIPSTTLTSTSVSGTAVLDTIAAAATIDKLVYSSAGSYFNSKITYYWTPKSKTCYHRCNIALNLNGTYTAVKTINHGQPGSLTQYGPNVTFSSDELSIIYKKLPSATKGTLRFTLRTYTDSGYTNEIGSGVYKEITLSIPNNADTQPTATMTPSPVSSLDSPLNSLYIKGKTKVDVNFTNGEGKYGASIVSYSVDINGKTYGSPYTSEYITADGDIEVKGTITDSRGFSRTYTQKIPFIPYTNPRVIPASDEAEVVCARCDSNGNLTESGTYLKIKAKRNYSQVKPGGVQKNFCSIQYRYKATGGSYSEWTTILDRTSTSDEVVTGALLGTFKVTSSYFVQIRAIDDVGESSTTTTTISTEKIYWHRSGSRNALALGKYVEEDNTFDVAEDITAIFRGKVNFPGEAWLKLDLYSSVSESEVSTGRYGGSGAYYRVCSGEKRICITFNVSFTTASSTVRVADRYKSGTSEYQIPEKYRPSYDVYALCPVGFEDGSRGIATVSMAPSGRVNIYAVHKLPGATLSVGDTVTWIDGYIDYWT